MHGRNEEKARGSQLPGRRMTMGHQITAGVPKSANNVTSTFFNTVLLLAKDFRL